MDINFKPTVKQSEIFNIFDDDITTEVVYGGSIGSGKSYLLASLICMKCLQYGGIRVGLARNSLTNLKKTTLVSVLECLGDWGLKPDEHYKYNSQSGIIKFFNDSEIVLVELTYLPSDSQYTRLGGLLLTFAAIDEGGEVDEMGKSIFGSRVGRWRNEKFGIKPFLIITCNPSRNFLYRDYYIPFREGILKEYQRFVPALPSDNPHLPKEYITNLERTLSMSERRRLLLGEWEWGDDDCTLFKYDDINLMFDTSIQLDDDKTMRMSCDIAFTSDRCVFIIWEGLSVIDIIYYDKLNNVTIVDKIKELSKAYIIKTSDISYDADGVGKYIKQYLPTAREIHNNGKTVANHGYRNLKAELFFKLSEFVADGKIKIMNDKYYKEVSEELSCVKHKPRETMNKIELIPKSDMKRLLGRSTDIADALAYGMIFRLKRQTMTSSDFTFAKF